MLQLNPEQKAFIGNISDDLVEIKDVIVAGTYLFKYCINFKKISLIILGPHGSGKTMLSVEAVKIKSAKFLETGEKVMINVLTFNNQLMEHNLLNAELKNTWFSKENHDIDEDQLRICHFTDFLGDILPGYKKSSPKSPEDFKHSMMLIGEKLNQNQNNKTIVMIDELYVDFTFRKSKSKKEIEHT